MQAKTVAQPVHGAPNKHFRLCVYALYTSHDLAAFFLGYEIDHERFTLSLLKVSGKSPNLHATESTTQSDPLRLRNENWRRRRGSMDKLVQLGPVALAEKLFDPL